jgi:hypothetical protein
MIDGDDTFCSLHPEHAKMDWKNHKLICKRLADAEWMTVTFNSNPWGQPSGGVMSMLNSNMTTQTDTVIQGTSDPPPNKHGSQPFIVKLQMNIMGRGAILVYDRERSISFQVVKSQTPSETWKPLDDAIAGTSSGVKLFAWAKRKSQWEVFIAVNQFPEQRLTW